jgi:hypothetical protein
MATKQGRELMAESIEQEVPLDAVISDIRVGRPRNLGVGAGSSDVLVTFRVFGARMDYHLATFRVERVLGLVGAMGVPGRRVPLVRMTRLAKTMAERMKAELTPRNTVLPTITGEPIVGQTLTANAGTWSGSPTAFGYQWQQCDAAGAACIPIAGATRATYVVTDAEVGRTLRVKVTARNSIGTSTATSAPTGVVRVLIDSVTGAGQRLFRTNAPPVHVEIDARSGSTGKNPSGSFLMRYPVGAWLQSGLELRGDVVCLTVRGNRASVGAVIRQSNSDLLPAGTGAWLAVTDNGQPGAGKDTQLSYLGSEVNPQVCTIPVQANEFPEIVLTGGDFVVHDE